MTVRILVELPTVMLRLLWSIRAITKNLRQPAIGNKCNDKVQTDAHTIQLDVVMTFLDCGRNDPDKAT